MKFYCKHCLFYLLISPGLLFLYSLPVPPDLKHIFHSLRQIQEKLRFLQKHFLSAEYPLPMPDFIKKTAVHTHYSLSLFCIFKTTYMLTLESVDQALLFSFWSSPRPISSSQLHMLPYFHLCPIYLVVFKGSYFFRMGYLILRGASRLDAFSVYPFRAWLPGYRLGSLTGAPAAVPSRSLVLRTAPLRYPTPTPDRDRTVSRRSEPSSRTALMGEQPNPWDLLQPQDAMSRHRGAKPLRRCELLGVISLLSPG